MFGKLTDMANLLRSAKDIQGNLAKLQEELAKRRFEGDAGGGMVRATVDGKGMLVDIRIDPQAANDVELLEDLVKASIGSAVVKAHEGVQREMAALTGGINVPGLMDMLGSKGG